MAEPFEQRRSWTEWFEIPVRDFERAKYFYEEIFSIQIEVLNLGTLTMGMFPHNNVGCAICLNEFYVPSENGLLVYLDANPDLNIVLNKIESAGGKILRNKTLISPEYGYMSLFVDSEGNRLALHSNQ